MAKKKILVGKHPIDYHSVKVGKKLVGVTTGYPTRSAARAEAKDYKIREELTRHKQGKVFKVIDEFGKEGWAVEIDSPLKTKFRVTPKKIGTKNFDVY